MSCDYQLKMYIWETPYPIPWGFALLCVVARNLDEAKLLGMEEIPRQMGSNLPPADFQLGKPDYIRDVPTAMWHFWSE